MTNEPFDLDNFLVEISERLLAVDSVAAEVSPAEQTETIQIVPFVLAGKTYAVELDFVREIISAPNWTPIPRIPAWILGVTNWYGSIISLVDLGRFLDLDGQPNADMMLVLEAADQQIGFLVELVRPLLTITAEQIESPIIQVQPELVPYLRGIIELDVETIHLLDCTALLTGPRMQKFDR